MLNLKLIYQCIICRKERYKELKNVSFTLDFRNNIDPPEGFRRCYSSNGREHFYKCDACYQAGWYYDRGTITR